MKKTIFLSLILIFAAGFFTSCIQSEYFDPWVETEGYVVTTNKNNERTGKNEEFSEFIVGDHPEGYFVAVRYEHELLKIPYCTFEVQTPQTDIDHDIIYEFMTDPTKTVNFEITSQPYNDILGFIFYCDNDKVYIINNLYKLGYVEHTNKSSRSKGDVRFVIKVNGIQKLELEMDRTMNTPY